MHIFHNKDTFAQICFGVDGGFYLQFSGGIESSIGPHLNKLIPMWKLYQFNQIRIEHKCAFEYAYDD